MMKRTSIGLLLIVGVANACSSTNTTGAAGGAGGSGVGGAAGMGTGGTGPSPDERDLLSRGGRSKTAIHQATVIADSLFDFDPTLVPSATAEMNAQNIKSNLEMNLPVEVCGQVALSGPTAVAVDFGPPPGCTLKNGVKASGRVTAAVTRTTGGSGSSITVALTFTSLVVNGKDLAGAVSFATTDGTTFTVTGDLVSGGDTTKLTLSIKGATGTFTINGTAETTDSGGAKTTYTFANVVYQKGKCYPSGGSLTISKGQIITTLTFTAQTADTGVMTVTQGRRSYMMTLPAYGACPTGAADGGSGG